MTHNYEALAKRLEEGAIHAAEMAIVYRRGNANFDADALRTFSENMGSACDAIRHLTALVSEARERLRVITGGDIDVSGTAVIYGNDTPRIMHSALQTLDALEEINP